MRGLILAVTTPPPRAHPREKTALLAQGGEFFQVVLSRGSGRARF